MSRAHPAASTAVSTARRVRPGTEVTLTAAPTAARNSKVDRLRQRHCNQCKVTLERDKAVDGKVRLIPGHSLLKLRKLGGGAATVTSCRRASTAVAPAKPSASAKGRRSPRGDLVRPAHDLLGRLDRLRLRTRPDRMRGDAGSGGDRGHVPGLPSNSTSSRSPRTAAVPGRSSARRCGSIAAPSAGGFDYGSEVTLIAAAADDSEFKGWSGACAGTHACRVTIDAAKTVNATFDALSSGSSESLPPGGDQPAVGPTEAEKLKQALRKCRKLKGRVKARCERKAKGGAKVKPKRHPRRHRGQRGGG